MNTFFRHRDVHKYTWYRPSMAQKSLIDLGPVQLAGSNGWHRRTEMWGNSLHPAWQQSSDNFRWFLRTLRWNGRCSEQRWFLQLLKAVNESGLEWRGVVRNEHLGETKISGKLSDRRKMLLKPFCKTGHRLICNPGIPKPKKLQLWQ